MHGCNMFFLLEITSTKVSTRVENYEAPPDNGIHMCPF